MSPTATSSPATTASDPKLTDKMHIPHVPPPKQWNFDIDRYLNPIVPRSRLHLLPKPISHWLGYREKPNQPLGNVIVAFWSLVGGFAGICVLSGFFMSPFIVDRDGPIIVGSFGAMAVLEYGAIESPFSQPRNALVGQFMAAVISVCITKLFQLSPHFDQIRFVAGALAVGVASAFMALTKTIHPPAGATALLGAVQPTITQLGWWYLPIVLVGSLLTTATACIVNNVQRQFPIYWWTPRAAPSKQEQKQKEEKDAEKAEGKEQERRGAQLREHGEGVGVLVHDKHTEMLITHDAIHLPAKLFLSTDEKRVLEILQQRLKSVEEEDRPLRHGSSSTLAPSDSTEKPSDQRS